MECIRDFENLLQIVASKKHLKSWHYSQNIAAVDVSLMSLLYKNLYEKKYSYKSSKIYRTTSVLGSLVQYKLVTSSIRISGTGAFL